MSAFHKYSENLHCDDALLMLYQRLKPLSIDYNDSLCFISLPKNIFHCELIHYPAPNKSTPKMYLWQYDW